MLTLLSVLLLSSHVIALSQSLECDLTTQYEKDGRCCKKCKPGEKMMEECDGSSQDTECKECQIGYFSDVYNTNFKWCPICKKCTGEHMKYKENCTTTSDAVCTCEEGYRCDNSKCEKCEKIPTTAHPPAPTTTQDIKYEKLCAKTNGAVCTCEGYRCSNSKCENCVKIPTAADPPAPTTTQDNVWISVSLCFACVCVCVLLTCFLLTSRHAQKCGWIISSSAGLWSTKKTNFRFSQCTEEEEVPMPVQEVCGKTEKLENV